jgi:hypothetical protein
VTFRASKSSEPIEFLQSSARQSQLLTRQETVSRHRFSRSADASHTHMRLNRAAASAPQNPLAVCGERQPARWRSHTKAWSFRNDCLDAQISALCSDRRWKRSKFRREFCCSRARSVFGTSYRWRQRFVDHGTCPGRRQQAGICGQCYRVPTWRSCPRNPILHQTLRIGALADEAGGTNPLTLTPREGGRVS